MVIIVDVDLSTNFTKHVLSYTSCMLQIASETLFNKAPYMNDIPEVALAYAGEIV